jgi:hypothetical protein
MWAKRVQKRGKGFARSSHYFSGNTLKTQFATVTAFTVRDSSLLLVLSSDDERGGSMDDKSSVPVGDVSDRQPCATNEAANSAC